MNKSSKEIIDIIDRLLIGKASMKERIKLHSYRFIEQAFHREWTNTSESSTDNDREQRMLDHILLEIQKKETKRPRLNFYRMGWAVAVALLLVFSFATVWQFTKDTEKEVMYIVKSGRQSLDSVRLADGSLVILSAGSQLSYPQKFAKDKREVLLSGQAFFNIHPDKSAPFIVRTKRMDITALGTAFEVFSFDNDQKVETILLNGKIKVEPKDIQPGTDKEYIITPNQKFTYTSLGKVSIEEVDADSYSAWRTGRLTFKNQTLEVILPRLEKWYGQKIDCDTRTAQFYRFTFTLRNEPLDLILNFISHSAPLNYKLINNDHYQITEKK